MNLTDLANQIPGFASWRHVPKIKLFAWHVHRDRGMDRFTPAVIAGCYDELHLEKPSSVGPILQGLMDKKPKEVLRDSRGYYLAKQVRDHPESR